MIRYRFRGSWKDSVEGDGRRSFLVGVVLPQPQKQWL